MNTLQAYWPSPSATADVPLAREVVMERVNGFVVVSWWRDKTCSVPPYKGSYQYEHFDALNDAYECLREYEAGEFSNATGMGVFAAKDGMPVGGRVL